MSAPVAVKERQEEKTDEAPDIHHYFKCYDEFAGLCGTDLKGWPLNEDETPPEELCIVCREMDESLVPCGDECDCV